MLKIFFSFFLFALVSIDGALIEEKVLICGVCKNIEKAAANTIQSIEKLRSSFVESHVIIYENNSTDQTVQILQKWAENDPNITFLTETLTEDEQRSPIHGKRMKREETIARARNIVIDVMMQERFDDYKYVIWADLDFPTPWDVENIIDSILNPEQEWDAILANGAYDVYAFRDARFPIGFELMGKTFWMHLLHIYNHLDLDPEHGKWRPVYSAFGGLGIYKRDSIKNCTYSAFITKELEQAILNWIDRAPENTYLLKEYYAKIANSTIYDLENSSQKVELNPLTTGVRLHPPLGVGQLVWFAFSKKCPMPNTCEHIPFHAAMAANGYDKIFVNPRIISNQPDCFPIQIVCE